MSELTSDSARAAHEDGPTAFGLKLLAAGAVLTVLAGGLLWWREGEKLFTDGLIAAIARCF